MVVATISRMTQAEINNLPQSEGVYKLMDYSKSVIYIGRTDNLRRRLNEHLSTSDTCIRSANYFTAETTFRSIDREREMLLDFRRRYGRLPRCNDRI